MTLWRSCFKIETKEIREISKREAVYPIEGGDITVLETVISPTMHKSIYRHMVL